MKRVLALALLVAACDPMGDFDLDLSGLEAGPIQGDQGVVTFALVDGCASGDWLFGCSKDMPPFAVGARVKFVVGAVSEDPRAQEIVDHATFEVSNPGVVGVGHDADGFVVMQAVAQGSATVELHDSKDGDLIDTIAVHVEPIAWMVGEAKRTVLVGSRVGVKVHAQAQYGETLYARGAIVATLSGGLELDADNSGFFMTSDQVAVRATTPGDAKITFTAGPTSIDVPYQLVARDEITSVSVQEFWHEPGANKQRIIAGAKVGETGVRGGPACDWRIVSGGGDGAALASGAGEDTTDELFVFYDSALVYGEGDMTVECRVNDQAMGQTTVHLGP